MHSGLELASALEPSLLQQTSDFSADLAARAQERHNVQQKDDRIDGDIGTRRISTECAVAFAGT